MRRLVLLRHGEAEPRARGGGDLDRRLTVRGAADAAAVGRALADQGVRPALALVSIAARTIETWEAASAAFPNTRAMFLRGLYDAEAEKLWTLFGEHDGETVILVGHNPGIHNLAATLAQRCAGPEAPRVARDFPPAACAVFVIEPGKVALETVIFPNDLSKGGMA